MKFLRKFWLFHWLYGFLCIFDSSWLAQIINLASLYSLSFLQRTQYYHHQMQPRPCRLLSQLYFNRKINPSNHEIIFSKLFRNLYRLLVTNEVFVSFFSSVRTARVLFLLVHFPLIKIPQIQEYLWNILKNLSKFR